MSNSKTPEDSACEEAKSQGIDAAYETAVADEQIDFKSLYSKIKEAVARGWASPKNKKKIMDVDLAMAISIEVDKLFRSWVSPDSKMPNLGCATTRELLNEITARIEVNGNLNYRTIDS